MDFVREEKDCSTMWFAIVLDPETNTTRCGAFNFDKAEVAKLAGERYPGWQSFLSKCPYLFSGGEEAAATGEVEAAHIIASLRAFGLTEEQVKREAYRCGKGMESIMCEVAMRDLAQHIFGEGVR